MKKLVIFGMLALAMTSVRADFLYWQVNSSTTTEFSDATYAMVKDLSGTALSIYYGGEWGNDWINVPMSGNAAVSVSENNSYYIELFHYDTATTESTSVAKSEIQTYTSLADGGFVTSSLSTVPTVWSGGSYTATPEPTSAMLMMLGFALMSLKRRKV